MLTLHCWLPVVISFMKYLMTRKLEGTQINRTGIIAHCLLIPLYMNKLSKPFCKQKLMMWLKVNPAVLFLFIFVLKVNIIVKM